MNVNETLEKENLSFYGGTLGAILPFVLFATSVIFLALSGAPDERGFWPILIAALTLGILMAKDRKMYSETVIHGMAQPIVMIMLTAWMLASTIGLLMAETGFVNALLWVASQLHLSAAGFTATTFIICCLISLSTGSSFATILIGGPLLYPAGGLLGADLPLLAGAILAGATFGDFFAPISDTTIASALSQEAPIGATVKSRLRFILPLAIIVLPVYYFLSSAYSGNISNKEQLTGDPAGLPMFLIPTLIIFLFLKGKHLLHGLLFGLLTGVILGWILGLLPATKIISLDLENFRAQSFIIEGINRATGISFFTILLMGLVETLKRSGLIDRLVKWAARHSHSPRQAESWIAAAGSMAVLLTTHSIVAILMVTDFTRQTGEKQGIDPIRRANILSMVVCVFPFLLPYFIPVILMANTTNSGKPFDIGAVSPLQAGLHNFISWGLGFITIGSLLWKKNKQI
jgi:Na+/H+ antiporter NhaC